MTIKYNINLRTHTSFFSRRFCARLLRHGYLNLKVIIRIYEKISRPATSLWIYRVVIIVIERNLGQRREISTIFISALIYRENWRTGNKVTTPLGNRRRFSSFFQVPYRSSDICCSLIKSQIGYTRFSSLIRFLLLG